MLLLTVADGIQRRLVLMVDNLDLVFARLEQDDDWALREILSREPRLLIIGATSQALETSFRYDKPFYDFFRLHVLEGLDEAQTFEVMRHLARVTDKPQVLEIVEREPGRIQTLRLLSGGNPRTLILLFNLLSQGTEGDARSDLERLLDQITPLYKHRFEELPAQAQRIVDALALGWDPMTARELAERLRFDVNAISAQLSRLVKQGVVEKTRLPGSSRTGFQIAERFFNIWYLMRASRRLRRRLIFLVKFLELFFPSDALHARARQRLRAPENSRDADYGFALAQVVEPGLRHALETHSLRAVLSDPRLKLESILDLDGEDRALRDRAARIEALNEAERAVLSASWEWPEGIGAAEFWELLGGSLSLSAREKRQIATTDLTPTHVNPEARWKVIQESDSDTICAESLNDLANLLQNHLSRFDEAEAAYRRAIQIAPNDSRFLNGFAWHLYTMNGDLEAAEQHAHRAVDGAPEDPFYAHTLACVQAARGRWPKEAAQRFLSASDEFRQVCWDHILSFFAEAIRRDHTREALGTLRLGPAERGARGGRARQRRASARPFPRDAPGRPTRVGPNRAGSPGPLRPWISPRSRSTTRTRHHGPEAPSDHESNCPVDGPLPVSSMIREFALLMLSALLPIDLPAWTSDSAECRNPAGDVIYRCGAAPLFAPCDAAFEAACTKLGATVSPCALGSCVELDPLICNDAHRLYPDCSGFEAACEARRRHFRPLSPTSGVCSTDPSFASQHFCCTTVDPSCTSDGKPCGTGCMAISDSLELINSCENVLYCASTWTKEDDTVTCK